ncbi:MAG: GNAT family N-acetyltransferase [Brachymonas sp.]|nr:GNAT family N-acetyltransferase [Brachymonas sp.]
MQAILAVQARAYDTHLIERASVLQAKVQAARADQPLSWGVALGHALDAPDALCGYAIACPWRLGLVPGLDAADLPAVHVSDCLYVHDIAVDPRHHGQGLAGRLLQQVLQQGRAYGWQQAVLVAVQGAHRYWSRYGFAPVADGPDVSSFGADAVWMQRAL